MPEIATDGTLQYDFAEVKTRLTDSEVLILTCYGEARGEKPSGQIAVLQTIMNRVKGRGQSIKTVCFAPLQFSCWNLSDANFPILNKIANRLINNEKDIDKAYKQIEFLAEGVMDSKLRDLTGGAQHYMTTSLYLSNRKPHWADAPRASVVIDSHIFLVL